MKNQKKILTRYATKKINPNFYGKLDITNLPQGQPGDKPGYILAPFIISDHTKESLEHYREFMKKYDEKHKFCPVCAGTDYTTTLMSYVLNTDKPEDYKDLNKCVCITCGNIHTKHDRISDEKTIL